MFLARDYWYTGGCSNTLGVCRVFGKGVVEKNDLGDDSEAGRSSGYFLHHTSSKSLPYVPDKGCERKERKMTRVAAQPYLIAGMFSTASFH